MALLSQVQGGYNICVDYQFDKRRGGKIDKVPNNREKTRTRRKMQLHPEFCFS